MTLKEILSKIFFCDEDSLNSVLLHIPVGLANVGICLFSGCLAVLFGVGFIFYELRESKVIQDKGYPELQGWLWGIGILAIILLIVG